MGAVIGAVLRLSVVLVGIVLAVYAFEAMWNGEEGRAFTAGFLLVLLAISLQLHTIVGLLREQNVLMREDDE